ncbi:MAG: hypothetical protein Fur0044_34280 [Anaerolineae bacterium]|nr:hypothetical protein [Anaerolineales bacterium]MCQ3973833.1 hypothetical protein [Anaerolineae bacterium]
MAENGELLPVYEVTNPTAEPTETAVSPQLWACKIINRSIKYRCPEKFFLNHQGSKVAQTYDLLPCYLF